MRKISYILPKSSFCLSFAEPICYTLRHKPVCARMVTAELVCTRASAVDEENILYFTEIKLRACHLRNPFVTHSDTVVAHSERTPRCVLDKDEKRFRCRKYVPTRRDALLTIHLTHRIRVGCWRVPCAVNRVRSAHRSAV